jgi:hypothetical protein
VQKKQSFGTMSPTCRSGTAVQAVGVADPFLKKAGQKFLLHGARTVIRFDAIVPIGSKQTLAKVFAELFSKSDSPKGRRRHK